MGASLVESINGCYFNVVGFPLHRFCYELIKILNQQTSSSDNPEKRIKSS